MKANESALRAQALLQPLYFQCRRRALALALVIAMDADAAYALSRDAFIRAGQRVIRRPQRDLELLRELWRRAQPPRAPKSDQIEASAPGISGLSRADRAAWALCRAGGRSTEEARYVLNLGDQALAAALERADAVLPAGAAEGFGRLIDRLQNRREIWGEVAFSLEQHYRVSRRVRVVLVGALLAALGFFIVREGEMALRIVGFPGPGQEAVVARGYEEADFYKRFAPRPGVELPRVEQRLYEQLEGLAPDQRLRVAFRFYDPALMADVREQGLSLLDLYLNMYERGQDWGRVHTLLARGIERYYDGYERPFTVRERKADFQSPYGSIREAALAVARGSGFSATVAAHPEIFRDEAGFNAYLSGQRFRSALPEAAALCYAYVKVEDATRAGESVPPRFREYYETRIFAFDNPGGLDGKLSPAGFDFTREDTDAFFPVRERLGLQLYERTLRLVKTLLPDAQVTSDLLEGGESSLYSATLSKKDLLRLAQEDERFQFIGIAAPYAEGYLPGLEHGLAAALTLNKERVYEVYQIDGEYVLYSINYAAPLTLPRGFIEQFRSKVDVQDTLFEQQISYTYLMRFAHPRQLPGWQILRNSYRDPSLNYALQQYKHFSKMDRN